MSYEDAAFLLFDEYRRSHEEEDEIKRYLWTIHCVVSTPSEAHSVIRTTLQSLLATKRDARFTQEVSS